MMTSRLRLLSNSPSNALGAFASALQAIDDIVRELETVRQQLEAMADTARSADERQYYTDKEVAELTRRTVQAVRNRCKKGVYPGAFSAGRSGWRIPVASLKTASPVRMSDAPGSAFDVRRLSQWREVANG